MNGVIAMRIRKKAWARPELDNCRYFIPEPEKQLGNWNKVFGEKRPIHLDLGCGKCLFLAETAYKHRDVNYVGIDLSYDILGVGRRNIAAAFGEEQPDNVAICYYNIERLTRLFTPDEGVERLYINFCNPWPTAGHHKRRLTHTRQLEAYKALLGEGGEIWFKTDNEDLYLATIRYMEEAGYEIFFNTRDLHSKEDKDNIVTEHELMFTSQGVKIKALRCMKK